MDLKKTHKLDTSGLFCPYPLAKTKAYLNTLHAGDVLEVISTDPASEIDFTVFAELSGNKIVRYLHENKQYIFTFQKGKK